MTPSGEPRFVHLHLHSEYSLLDGGNRIKKLVDRVKDLGMDAVALTDHGNLHGAAEFYRAAKAVGVKPILGIEAYVAPGDRRDRTRTGVADGGFHLVLLAENEIGWRNLLKLSSDSFLRGFYYRPRMDKSTLTEWSDGLIAINGHLGSSIAHHLLQYAQTGREAHYQAALDEAKWHAETFGVNEKGEPRFYVEIQSHGVAEQERINPHLIRVAHELNLPVVADNDSHFLTADDWDVHDTLCCISMQKIKQETERLHYPKDLYVKSPAQMAEALSEWLQHAPECMDNTVRIGARCNVDLDSSANHAPVVRIVSAYDEWPTDSTSAQRMVNAFDCEHAAGWTEWFYAFSEQFTLEPYHRDHDTESAEELKEHCDGALRMLAEAGAIWRYGPEGVTREIRERLDRELGILADKLISAYFLIVWDFVNWARQRGIPAHARGSGVGTMVGYVLGLSNACPVKYGLLFERFTDPDRSEYPDIDIDICQDGRADVINYVRDKYGHVAQIITFGRLKAKAAIKDVARVMGLGPAEGQRLANFVPGELNITIDAALDREPDFKAEYNNNSTVRRVVDTARALEGHARHAGVHAAGVVIATEPLENIVPLCRPAGKDESETVANAVTQWDGPTCERVGLLKMDFLGLRTLSTIERARTLIEETLPEEAIWRAVGKEQLATGGTNKPVHPLDLDRLTFDDQRVLSLFRRSDTAGVFQFESGGMRKLLMEMQPDRLEDLIAANALFRPGPMDLIPEYCQRKNGRQAVPKVHEIVDNFTDETYGIMVYQEQVMQIVHGLGGIPLRSAYSLIKAISKKKHEIIDAERPKFIEGAQDQGLSKAKANDLFDLILKFAGYGFNKSHSTGYAIIAYQTAYLKTYFPNQYMAAVLTFESAAKKVEDWVAYLEEAKRIQYPDHTEEHPHSGVVVEPPDINLSDFDFTVVFHEDEPHDNLHGHVRFGLSAIKGVASSAIREVIEERKANGSYRSIFDFCERVDLRAVNKATIESLVKCGAFDSVHGQEQRAAMFGAIEDAISGGQSAAEDRRSGQMNIFGDMASAGAMETTEPALPDVSPWDQMETLAQEKATLGIHVSGHPLDRYQQTLEQFCEPLSKLSRMPADAGVAVGGMLTSVRTMMTRTGASAGQKMAMITIQDKTMSIDGVVFADAYAQYAGLIHQDACVLLVGQVDAARPEGGIKVQRVLTMENAAAELAGWLELELIEPSEGESMLARLDRVSSLLRQFAIADGAVAGRGARVLLHLHTGGKRVTIRPRTMHVSVDAFLIEQLKEMLGEPCVNMRRGDLRIKMRDRRNGRGGKSRQRHTARV